MSTRHLSLAVVAAVAFAIAGGLVVRYLAGARPSRQATTATSGPPSWASPADASSGSGADLVLRVPHAPASIVIDGDTDDPGWLRPPGPARTGEFVTANGDPARPHSDARLLWGDEHLYVTLYAADENIVSRTDQPDGPLWIDDSFRMTFTRGDVEYDIEVSPRGIVTDGVRKKGGTFDYSWSSGAHVSHEMDGTLNDSADMDEEWVIEMAIPLESFGMKAERGASIGLALRRCDTPKGSARTCASWGEGEARGRIVLD